MKKSSFSNFAVTVCFLSHALVGFGLFTESSYSLCPNYCSGHGLCLSENATISCSCFNGYHGGDCSYRICPAGTAWFDYPSADNTAHAAFTECSNMVLTSSFSFKYLHFTIMYTRRASVIV